MPALTVEVLPLRRPLNADQVRKRWYALPNALLLESAATQPPAGRFSYYALAAGPPAQFGVDAPCDPFTWLQQQLHREHRTVGAMPAPFVGGWVGFIGYESAQFLEPFPRRHREMPGLPLAAWWTIHTLLTHDHAENRWHLSGCDFYADGPRGPSPADRLRRLRDWLNDLAADDAPTAHPSADAMASETDRIGAAAEADPEARYAYEAGVRSILDHIHAGDVFQVNLAYPTVRPWRGDPSTLYERLRRSNAARFAAYLPWDSVDSSGHTTRSAVLSSSPELFLDLRERRVITRPIKGTRPRCGDPIIDARAQAELEACAKDRAELVMIVDLLRNDLGRVCEYGSVQVTSLGDTEAHPTVLHRVAEVTGLLRRDCDAIDLLRAAFPCGSVTGAPKVRAMQIIDALEKSPRGPYCGAIGYLGVNGDLMLNVAIRTIAIADETLHYWSGAGIVADSNPQAEYEETLAKSAGIRRALRSDGVS